MRLLRQAKTDSFSGKAFFIFLIRFFPALANVLVLIYFSRHLGRDAYGQYQNYWVQTYVLGALAGMGLQAFLITYTPEFVMTLIRKLSRRSYAYGLIWITAVSALFGFLQNSATGISFIVPFFFLIVYTSSTILESLHFVNKRFGFLLVINILHTVCFVWLHYMAANNLTELSNLFGWLLILAIVRLALYVMPLPKLVSKYSDTVLDKPISEIRSLWAHLAVYDVSQFLFRYIDKFILTLLLSKELFAIYFNGSQEIPFLSLLLGAAGSAALMQLSDNKQAGSDAYAVALQRRSSQLLSCIVFPLFFFFLAFRSEVFTVLLSEKYIPAIPIFLVSIVVVPLRAYSFTTILQNRHKGGIINTGSVGDIIVACVLMYPLYLWLGLPGVAMSFVISSYLQAGYYLHHTAKLVNKPVLALIPLSNWLIKLMVFGCLLISLHYILTLYLSPEMVLICGILSVMVISVASIIIEFKTGNGTQHA